MSIFTTNLGISGRWNFFHQFLQLSKNTNNLHTWALTSFSNHSFSPWSCVIKTKCLNNSALLLKCVITFSSKITKCCKENFILLYNYYYENSTNPIFLGREWICPEWLRTPIISEYFDNIQPGNCLAPLENIPVNVAQVKVTLSMYILPPSKQNNVGGSGV